ncbi:MAG TPA: M3 family oligoendopeptidase [Candidatus Saccharimonadales bacterium]|nr:M3 family oligoendopeptidase [Candidatus Saccharimonadales bacterium]
MKSLHPKITTWNLTPLFKSDTDKNISLERTKLLKESYKFINKYKDRTDYLSDPKILLEALNDFEEWSRKYGVAGKEGFYLQLRTAQDQSDTKLKANLNKLQDLAMKISNDAQFFTHRLAKVDIKTQKKFLADPILAKYHHFLEKAFEQAKYILTEPEEKILTLMSPMAMSNWTSMTSEFISKESAVVLGEDGKKRELPIAALGQLFMSQNKKVRDSAFNAVNSIILKHSDVAEHEMNSILATKKTEDELRGFARPELERHLADDISTDVVDTMINSVQKRFDISQRFYKLKARLHKLPKLQYHERNIEYGKFNKKYSYEDSINLVHKVFADLDPKFAEIVESFVNNGQLDVYPRKNKSGGGFCAHDMSTLPIYILLNHQDKLQDVLTIAHEFGHAINNELMKKQSELYFHSTLSTAEVASTFMEDFVFEEILKGVNDEERLAILVLRMSDRVNAIQRQVSGYLFEQELHKTFREKGYLSKQEIGKIFKKNMLASSGSTVEMQEGTENWWVHWHHFRMFFYVYSYASGLLISMALQNSVRQDKNFISKVKNFLSAGASDSPVNIFAKLGVDIKDPEFWNKGLDEEELLLDEIETLAKKLGKYYT